MIDKPEARALIMALDADPNDLELAAVHKLLDQELSNVEVDKLGVAAHSLWRVCREVTRRRHQRSHALDNRSRWDDLDARR